MRRIGIVLSLVLLGFTASANAATITVNQNWGPYGYSVYDLVLPSASTVDINWTSGYGDAEFALFDSAGNHIILNDDQFTPFTLDPRVTQSLAAGQYSVLTTYCCFVEGYLFSNGATQVGTDGFNDGWYLEGGSGTLAGAKAWLEGSGALEFLEVENLDIEYTIETDFVPEPATMLLLGGGLAGLGGRRLRNRRRG